MVTDIAYPENRTYKPLMESDVLRDVISISLWAGQMLLQHGVDSARVEETVHRLGTGLGCDWMDVIVQPNAIILTTVNNHQFRTKARRIPIMDVNMDVATRITNVVYQVQNKEMDRFDVRRELVEIDQMPRVYNRWLVVVMVGLSCAAFSRLFGANLETFLVTWLAASTGMWLRQQMHRLYFNSFLIVMGTALTASLIASLAIQLFVSGMPDIALAASVLLLIPGAPLINALEDIINGHTTTGIARGTVGLIIALSIAVGITLALWITNRVLI
jgi:uncharacterized membrane protein YjjP (DUF1212 family)